MRLSVLNVSLGLCVISLAAFGLVSESVQTRSSPVKNSPVSWGDKSNGTPLDKDNSGRFSKTNGSPLDKDDCGRLDKGVL